MVSLYKGENMMNTPDEKQETAQTAAYNPFPEPQTIPAGWDTSVFESVPQPMPVKQAEVAEGELKLM